MLMGDVMSRPARPGLGFVVGLVMGVLASLYAVVLYLTNGPRVFQEVGTTFGQAVTLYVGGGILGGWLGGWLLPIAARRAGAALVGAIAATPFFLSIALVRGDSLDTGLVPAVVIGAIVGYGVWTPPASEATGGHAKDNKLS